MRSLLIIFCLYSIFSFAQIKENEAIDKIFELFTEDFKYVHPKYGGIYTREDLYNGYKNSRYDGSAIDVEITNKIVIFKSQCSQYLKKV